MTSNEQLHLIELNLAIAALMRLTLIACAFLVIRMGYRLLQDGVRGCFKFQSKLSGIQADLASASPGTLFLVMGVVILIYAITVKPVILFDLPVAG